MAAEPQTYEPEKLTCWDDHICNDNQFRVVPRYSFFHLKNQVIFTLKQNKKPTECKVALMPHFECQNAD